MCAKNNLSVAGSRWVFGIRGVLEWSVNMLLDFILGYHLQDWAQKGRKQGGTSSKQWQFGLRCWVRAVHKMFVWKRMRSCSVTRGDRDAAVLGCGLSSGFWKSLGWGQQVLKNQLYHGSEGGQLHEALNWGHVFENVLWGQRFMLQILTVFKVLVKFCIF